MLVIQRKVGETVVVGEDVSITVEEVRGKSVKLAVTAPPHVMVDRDEIRARRLSDGEGSRVVGLWQNVWDEGPGMRSRCVTCGFIASSAGEVLRHRCGGDAGAEKESHAESDQAAGERGHGEDGNADQRGESEAGER